MLEHSVTDRNDAQAGFRIYRAAEARPMARAKERGSLRASHDEGSPGEVGMANLIDAGLGSGGSALVIFSSPSLHISLIWFKSGFPLPLHSHDVDCFYHVTAGTLRVGKEDVGRNDGLFVPAGTPYSFTPGPEGVEFIEIRTSDDYDTEFRPGTPVYWERLVATARQAQQRWQVERPPLG